MHQPPMMLPPSTILQLAATYHGPLSVCSSSSKHSPPHSTTTLPAPSRSFLHHVVPKSSTATTALPASSSTRLKVLTHPPIKSLSHANLPITVPWEGGEKFLSACTSAATATMQSDFRQVYILIPPASGPLAAHSAFLHIPLACDLLSTYLPITSRTSLTFY